MKALPQFQCGGAIFIALYSFFTSSCILEIEDFFVDNSRLRYLRSMDDRKQREESTTFLGKCNFRGNDRVFGMKQQDRRQHTYVIGKTGTGKTTLLENMVLQDVHAGRGVGVIDPHGEFVERILSQIPAEREKDVVYFNPVDMEYPMGFNVLEVADQKYKHLIVSDLLGIFTKIWANVWSARMEYILQNCIMALLDTPGTTLLGIPRILVDKDYREKIIANVKDPVVRSFWIHEYETWRDQFRNEAIVPIQNKVGQFLNTGFIRNIVGQSKSTLNVPEIMNTRKILLVNVSKGKVGEDNSQLLGAMIITKIQLAAMERVRIPEEDRQDFYLYVDEFQNFATDSFAGILSEARKYRLNLIIAHQYVGQLVTDVSTKVRDAVFGNVGTMMAFRIGAGDAEFLEKEFTPEFVIEDLINLPNYHIYLKLMVDGITSRPFSAATLFPLKFEVDPSVKEKVIRMSRERYAVPYKEVEEGIARWSGISGGMAVGGEEGGGGSSAGTATMFETKCWNCGKDTTVPFKPDGRRPVYCLSCLKQIEEGKIIPLPERMPQVGRERFGESLAGLGIEFSQSGKQPPAAIKEKQGSPAPRILQPKDDQSRRPTIRPPMQSARPPSVPIRQQPRPPEGQGGVVRPREFSPREPHGQERRASSGPRREIPSRPAIRSLPGGKPLSLGQLKSREGIVPPEKEGRRMGSAGTTNPPPDVAGLRKVLDEFVSRGGTGQKSETPQNQEAVSSDLPKKSDGEPKKEAKVINPGEAIKW